MQVIDRKAMAELKNSMEATTHVLVFSIASWQKWKIKCKNMKVKLETRGDCRDRL